MTSLVVWRHHHSAAAAVSSPVTANENLITNGQWSYMPGTELKPDGLHITHRGFEIVEQTGSGGQPNPPVNEYGTHVRVPASFELRATLKNVRDPVSLQLYAQPPLISDEFRVEPKSIRLEFNGNSLTVSRWDGSGTGDLARQTPAAQQSFKFKPAQELHLTVTDTIGRLAIRVNEQPLGFVADSGTFNNHEIWFGADAEAPKGQFTLSSLSIEARNGGKVVAVDTSNLPVLRPQTNTLQALASQRRPGFLIGADAALWAVTSNSSYRQRLLGGDFGIITPENELKWQFVEPQPGIFDFHVADALVEEANKHGVKIHGHNLVFSEALPRWLQDLPTDTAAQKAYVRQVLIRHVSMLVSHYKGRIDGWDINEVFADYDAAGNLPAIYNDNVFYRAMGPDYVKIAAEAARAANPDVKIWINDFGAETDTDTRWQAMYAAIKSWRQTGVPIYGFGFESHIYDTSTDLIVDQAGNAPTLKKHIQDLADLGIMSRVSEMDAPLQGDYGASSQSKQFVGVLRTCLALPSCQAFSMWSIGPTDRYQDNDHRLQPPEIDSLFGPAMATTPAYNDLQTALRQSL